MQVPTCKKTVRLPEASGMIDRGELTLLAEAAGLGGARTIYLAGLWPERGRLAQDDGREIYPASMIKTPLAAAIAMAVSRRELTFEDRVRIAEANMTPNDGPSPLEAGMSVAVGEKLWSASSLQHSDNVATNVLYDVVGRDRAYRPRCGRWGCARPRSGASSRVRPR